MQAILTKTQVQYNRRAKQWECISPNGDVATFPSGQAGREAAWLMFIRLEDQPLYYATRSVMERHAVLSRRAWRAARIILKGDVKAGSTLFADAVVTVKSQTREGLEHVVSNDHGRLACLCEDYQLGHAPTIDGIPYPLCKHVLIVHILTQLHRLTT